MTDTTLYEVLGIATTADAAEIKSAYRSKAQQNHPDKGGDKEAFQLIQEAYEVLSDPDRRARYDSDGTYRHEARPTEEQKVNAAAQNGIMQVLTQIIDGIEQVEYSDLFEVVTKEVAKLRDGIEGERDGLTKRLDKHEKAVSRIKAKDGHDNVAALLMQAVITSIKGEIEKAEFAVKVGNRMIELIGQHTYEKDDMPEDLQNEQHQKEAKALEEMFISAFAQRFGGRF